MLGMKEIGHLQPEISRMRRDPHPRVLSVKGTGIIPGRGSRARPAVVRLNRTAADRGGLPDESREGRQEDVRLPREAARRAGEEAGRQSAWQAIAGDGIVVVYQPGC